MTIETPRAPQADPHAPPPRYKNKSGPVLRVVILAGILGVAAAGYALYSDRIEEAKNTPMVQEEQDLAFNSAPPPADSLAPAPADAAPAAPASESTAPAAPPASEPLPAPTTTTEPGDPLASGEPG